MREGVELSTERLLLRPIRLTDIAEVIEYSMVDDFSRHFGYFSVEHVEAFVAQNVLAPWDVGPRFSIVLDSKVIGGIGLTIDKKNKIAEIAYSMAKEHWGKGIITEAARRVVRWGFEELGLEKIYAHSDVLNVGSWHVMEKLGMTREGLLSGHSLARGVRHDDVYYGLLCEDWEASKALLE